MCMYVISVVCFLIKETATTAIFSSLPALSLRDALPFFTGFGLAGGFVGLSAGGTHPYGAEAVDRVELCQFSIRQLHELFTCFPEMEHRLLDMREIGRAHV